MTRCIGPTRRDLVADQGVAVTVCRAGRQRRVGLTPDLGVVALGEGDGIRIGILAAVQREDLRARNAPGRNAFLEALANQLAHLDVVEADIVRFGSLEGSAVIANRLDAMRLRILLDLRADRTVKRIEDQHLRALGDIRLGKRQFLGIIALRVVDLELR